MVPLGTGASEDASADEAEQSRYEGDQLHGRRDGLLARSRKRIDAAMSSSYILCAVPSPCGATASRTRYSMTPMGRLRIPESKKEVY